MTTLIVRTVSKAVLVISLLFSIYLLLNGGNYPGGGFIGGVLLVCGISGVYLAYGADEIDRLIKPVWTDWIGFGLLFASLTALAPLLVGHHYFRSSFAHAEIDLFGLHIGTVEFVSSMMFDVGVYFTVVGALLFIITQTGAHKVATAGKETEDSHSECIDGSCRVVRTMRPETDDPAGAALIKSGKTVGTGTTGGIKTAGRTGNAGKNGRSDKTGNAGDRQTKRSAQEEK